MSYEDGEDERPIMEITDTELNAVFDAAQRALNELHELALQTHTQDPLRNQTYELASETLGTAEQIINERN